MKLLLTERRTVIPPGISIDITRKSVSITGPRGTLTRDFTSAQVEISLESSSVIVRCYLGDRHQRAMVGTISAHISNMISGVLAGYEVEMRSVYAHFPIRHTIDEDKCGVEIGNFVGKKKITHVRCPEGVTIEPGEMGYQNRYVKSLKLQGNDKEKVTEAAATLHRVKPKDKDPVKFRDGLYRNSLKYVDKEVLGREEPVHPCARLTTS